MIQFKVVCLFITCISLCLQGQLNAQELPPVRNFTPGIYAAENQNWSIDQQDTKRMYFANNSGLLTYNGAQWKLYDSPNNTIIRAVKRINNKIYTGSYMEFGFWEEDNKGILQYTSLSKQITGLLIDDEHFWNIFGVDEWVIFQSLDAIYLYNTSTGEFKQITVGASIIKAYNVNDTIYFQATGKGLYKIANAEAKIVNQEALFRNEPIVNIFMQQEDLLILTQHEGFYTLSDHGLVRDPVDDFTLENKTVYSGIRLRDGRFAVGTISNGLYLFDKNRTLSLNINQGNGLGNNTVLTLFEDVNNNLWLGLDHGISTVALNSPFSVYHDSPGLLGTVYTSYKDDNFLYLGTNQGLFYRPLTSGEKFELVPGTSGQVWCLKELYGTLFCGHNKGTYIVEGAAASHISKIPGTWDFKKIPGVKNQILQGNYEGLYILNQKGSEWNLSHKLKGFDISSRYFEFVEKNQLIVSHEYKGLYLLDSNDNNTEVLNYKNFEDPTPGQKSGLTSYMGKVLYSYPKGVLVYDNDIEKFKPDTIINRYAGVDSLYVSGKLVTDTQDQRLWAFTSDGLIFYEMDDFDSTMYATEISLPVEVRNDMQGFENISNLGSNQYLLGTVDGYIILDLKKIDDPEYFVQLNSVKNGGRNKDLHALKLNTDVTLEAEQNNMSFSFNLPVFKHFKEVYYRYRLIGFNDTWGDWKKQSFATYNNLPHGKYVFEVQGRAGGTVSTNTQKYSFIIKRPWYLSLPAIIIYGMIGLGILVLIHVYNLKYYRKKEFKIKQSTERKLALAKSESERELIQLQNEKLENDFKSKSRELAASAMSIVRKNELLTAIKKDLEDLKHEKEVRSVIRTIDKNIDHSQDWSFFEEAFTNADKDFFKRIKGTHPKLTSKDLKLCAYLRLNLSSKEIAPLLNISVRSVEIKRYRLRKKMDLAHEDGLVEYILSF